MTDLPRFGLIPQYLLQEFENEGRQREDIWNKSDSIRFIVSWNACMFYNERKVNVACLCLCLVQYTSPSSYKYTYPNKLASYWNRNFQSMKRFSCSSPAYGDWQHSSQWNIPLTLDKTIQSVIKQLVKRGNKLTVFKPPIQLILLHINYSLEMGVIFKYYLGVLITRYCLDNLEQNDSMVIYYSMLVHSLLQWYKLSL
jgi:hypothetical protein